jgi:hypothetical protein
MTAALRAAEQVTDRRAGGKGRRKAPVLSRPARNDSSPLAWCHGGTEMFKAFVLFADTPRIQPPR